MHQSTAIRRSRLPYLVLLLAGSVAPISIPAARAAETAVVTAETETEPVESVSDAADDAAIWSHPAEPALSLVIGTDKRGGAVEVYDLAGTRLQRITGARANGVDIRQGVPLGDRVVDLVAVGGDDHRFFQIDATTRRLLPMEIGADGSRVPPNGVCLYRSAPTGKLYIFGISLRSEVEQLEVSATGGRLDLVPVGRRWDVGSDSEACVADDDLGQFYVNEADVAIWKYRAEPHEPTRPADRTAVDRTGTGNLVADVEGLTIVYQPGGAGYLLASSQGEDAFTVYERNGDNAFLRKFRVEGGRHTDGCSNTDGIDAYAGNLGPAFPHGLFVCQDHSNVKPGSAGNQNFKFVRLERILSLQERPPAVPLPVVPHTEPPVDETSAVPDPVRFDRPISRQGGIRTAPPPVAAEVGYWLATSDGAVHPQGAAGFFGSAAGRPLHHPVVGMAATPTGRGYWLVASDGGIFSFGDAAFHGSTGALTLNHPVVGMAATPTGRGYWLVASDGGIFSFGDATFHGSTGALTLNHPVVGMAATPTGRGYWLVASDGGIFSFRDAAFHGSTGALTLNHPVVDMAATRTGRGYWLVASDGGIFAFGDAAFHGSTGGLHLNQAITDCAAAPGGDGYWLAASDGRTFAFGNAATGLPSPATGMALTGIVAMSA